MKTGEGRLAVLRFLSEHCEQRFGKVGREKMERHLDVVVAPSLGGELHALN